MTERTDHPAATHGAFPYFFANAGTEDHGTTNRVHGINFNDQLELPLFIGRPKWINDLAIFYGAGLTEPNYLDVRCSRWDVQNYSVIIETWLKKSEVNSLLSNVRPGAVSEFYNILGRPTYIDTSWEGYNTIRLYPTPSSQQMNDSTLKRMRKPQIIYPKNITVHPLGNTDWINTKIEGFISGNSL